MTEQIHVAKWGRSLGVRIPRRIAESMRLEAGDTLELTSSEDGLLIKKAQSKSKRYALADILDSFAPAGSYDEVDFGEPQGKALPNEEFKALVSSLRGSMAWLNITVDKYLTEKHNETDAENKAWGNKD